MATLVATVVSATAGVQLDATFATTVTQVSMGRYDPSGFVQLIRAGDVINLKNGLVTIFDYEAPLDVPIHYVVTQVTPAGPPNDTANSATITLPSNGLSWLKDPALPSKNMPLKVVTSIASLTRPGRAGVFNILDRAAPIVVTNKRQSPVGELVFHTLTDSERIAATDLLAQGTILLLQTPQQYAWGSQYIYVSDVVEARLGLAMEPARMWTLPFVVVERPEGLSEHPATDHTWQAVKDTHATWSSLAATGKTYDELLMEGP